MTLNELIEELQELANRCDESDDTALEDPEVVLAIQPAWPLVKGIEHLTILDGRVWIAASDAEPESMDTPYAPQEAWGDS